MEVYEGTSVIITHLNHVKDLCALTTVCISAGAEGSSHPSQKAVPCEELRTVDLVTSWLSSPHETPFMVGLESSSCGKRSEGLWGPCSIWAREWREGQQSPVSVPQGGLLHGDTRIYWLHCKMARTVLFHKISRCSQCGVQSNECDDSGDGETWLQFVQEGNITFSA